MLFKKLYYYLCVINVVKKNRKNIFLYYLSLIKRKKPSMKQSLTYTKTNTMWPAVMPTTGAVCIIAGVDYSRGNNMGVLTKNVS